MKPATKMGVIALISICVLFYQYHLSTEVRFDQMTDFNAPGVVDNTENVSGSANTTTYFDPPNITEELIRSAVSSVQLSNGLSPDIASQLIQELTDKLVPKNMTKSRTILEHKTAPTQTADPLRMRHYRNRTQKETVDPLYIITPTYRRPEQIPELTRMSHTLMLVTNVHWLVIEDAAVASKQITEFLDRTGLKYEHLVAPMPEKYKQKKGAKPRGVSNRNRGLQWVRNNAENGVLYFADDDNTYDIELFDEIRRTKKVSMFPVGLCTKFGMSSPVVKDGKFVGFYDGWVAGRKFPVDMAGFAVNVEFLKQRPNATMPFRAGYEEDGFLKSLAPFEPKEIELLAENCSKVLAWHTQTKKNEPSAALDMKHYGATNLVKLKQQIV